MKTITEDIFTWSEKFVEVDNKALGGWPLCPYAKQARLKDQVKVVEVADSKDFLDIVIQQARTIKEQHKKLIIVASDDFDLEAYELGCYVDALNHIFVPDDRYLMAFHPFDDSEEVEFLKEDENDYVYENEFYMVLIQPYSELEEASEHLAKQGYYEGWEEEYYQDTVLKRQSYRRLHDGWQKEKS